MKSIEKIMAEYNRKEAKFKALRDAPAVRIPPKPKRKAKPKPKYWCGPGFRGSNPYDKIRINRKAVYAKYNGHCAYCGTELEYKEMEVDHIVPIAEWGEDNRMINLNPSCKLCNNFKRDKPLCDFRAELINIHNAISIYYMVKVASKYGLIKIKPFNGKFYFEKKVRGGGNKK